MGVYFATKKEKMSPTGYVEGKPNARKSEWEISREARQQN